MTGDSTGLPAAKLASTWPRWLLIRTKLIHAFWKAVRALPDRQRSAIVLRYVEDMAVIEIAKGTTFASTAVVRTLKASITKDVESSVLWDGKDSIGALVPTGTYTARLSVTDGLDSSTTTHTATSTATRTPTRTPFPTSIHIGDLDATSAWSGNKWSATISIAVHDSNERLAPNAKVTGSWSGGVSATGSCTTSSTGRRRASIPTPGST